MFRKGDHVRVIKPHLFNGEILDHLKVGVEGVVNETEWADSFTMSTPHVGLNGWWIDVTCLESADDPSEEEVREALTSLTGHSPEGMTKADRKALREALREQGFARASYTDDIAGTGDYAETWTRGENTVTIQWAKRGGTDGR